MKEQDKNRMKHVFVIGSVGKGFNSRNQLYNPSNEVKVKKTPNEKNE